MAGVSAALAAGGVSHMLLAGGVLPRLNAMWVSQRAATAVRAQGLDPRNGVTPGPVAVAGYAEPSIVFALGIAAVSPPLVYAGISSLIGALGAFMTSSSTASNVLFGGVQSDVAHLHGLSAESIIAAQAAGSAYGNAIAPANIVLGTSIAGIKGKEGAVLRLTIWWTVVVAVLTGIGTILLVLFT